MTFVWDTSNFHQLDHAYAGHNSDWGLFGGVRVSSGWLYDWGVRVCRIPEAFGPFDEVVRFGQTVVIGFYTRLLILHLPL